METTNKGEFEAAFEAGMLAGAARMELEIPYALAPANMRVESLEPFMAIPARKRGKVMLREVESFVAYVNAHKEEGTQIFAVRTKEGAALKAVLDHHTPGKEHAGWGQHVAEFVTDTTEEWKRWLGADGKRMSQGDFGQFLEDNVGEIIRPDGAAVLEVARRLEAKRSVAFTAGVRLENGDAALRYEETTEAKVGTKGEMEVPTNFQIGLRLFEGSPAYEVPCRLRWRIGDDRKLVLWYELVNAHLVVKEAVKELLATVRAETGLAPLMGQING